MPLPGRQCMTTVSPRLQEVTPGPVSIDGSERLVAEKMRQELVGALHRVDFVDLGAANA